MTITVRPIGDRDFFSWIPLFAGYAEFYESPFSDETALTVWQWLNDSSHELEAVVAVEAGEMGDKLVGFAHFREVPRTLESRRGLYLDDLFVDPEYRGSGVGSQLIEAVRELGEKRGHSLVRWITSETNEAAQKVYDKVADRTSWVTYEIRL